MAKTLLNLRDLLRIELRDPDGYTFQDADCDYALNQAYRKTFMRVVKFNQDYFVTPTLLDVVGQVREIALPDDFLKAKSIELVVGNLWIPLKRRIRAATINATSAGSININTDDFTYDFEGDNICLEPTPQVDRDAGLRLTYYQTYIELVSDSDEINSNFKDIWIDVLILEAAVTCFSQIEAIGGRVDIATISGRLKDAVDMLEHSLGIRTLSPIVLRKKRYFQ